MMLVIVIDSPPPLSQLNTFFLIAALRSFYNVKKQKKEGEIQLFKYVASPPLALLLCINNYNNMVIFLLHNCKTTGLVQ
jgi:hypothetical protein